MIDCKEVEKGYFRFRIIPLKEILKDVDTWDNMTKEKIEKYKILYPRKLHKYSPSC